MQWTRWVNTSVHCKRSQGILGCWVTHSALSASSSQQLRSIHKSSGWGWSIRYTRGSWVKCVATLVFLILHDWIGQTDPPFAGRAGHVMPVPQGGLVLHGLGRECRLRLLQKAERERHWAIAGQSFMVGKAREVVRKEGARTAPKLYPPGDLYKSIWREEVGENTVSLFTVRITISVSNRETGIMKSLSSTLPASHVAELKGASHLWLLCTLVSNLYFHAHSLTAHHVAIRLSSSYSFRK